MSNTQKKFKAEGFWVQRDLVDEQGRSFEIRSRSTIVSDHKFDTSLVPNWMPDSENPGFQEVHEVL